MTIEAKCQWCAQQQGQTWDADATFAAMNLDPAVFFEDTKVMLNDDPEPPVDPPEPNSIGQDYMETWPQWGQPGF